MPAEIPKYTIISRILHLKWHSCYKQEVVTSHFGVKSERIILPFVLDQDNNPSFSFSSFFSLYCLLFVILSPSFVCQVTKRDEDSSLMQLKEEFRTYEALRREHDAQIVHIAMEAGLRISPEQWSSLLYGDLVHKSHMQSIIDKVPVWFTHPSPVTDSYSSIPFSIHYW